MCISLDLDGPKIHTILFRWVCKRVAWWHDAMQMMQRDEMHDMNKMQNNRQNPTTKGITYHISGKGKIWSYEYGKLHPGRYNTPPLQEDLVPRSRMAPERSGRWKEEVKQSCFFDKRVKPRTLRGWAKWKKENHEDEQSWKHFVKKERSKELY